MAIFPVGWVSAGNYALLSTDGWQIRPVEIAGRVPGKLTGRDGWQTPPCSPTGARDPHMLTYRKVLYYKGINPNLPHPLHFLCLPVTMSPHLVLNPNHLPSLPLSQEVEVDHRTSQITMSSRARKSSSRLLSQFKSMDRWWMFSYTGNRVIVVVVATSNKYYL
jgi:hypothetical protein